MDIRWLWLCIIPVLFFIGLGFSWYRDNAIYNKKDIACKRIWKKNEKINVGDIGLYSNIRWDGYNHIDVFEECEIVDFLDGNRFLIRTKSTGILKVIKRYRFLKKRTEEEQFDMILQMPKDNTIYEDIKTIEGGK